MLVLSRKKGEVIDVTAPGGQRLEITIVEIDRGKVRIGIAAPKEYLVNRREVTEEIEREQHDSTPVT